MSPFCWSHGLLTLQVGSSQGRSRVEYSIMIGLGKESPYLYLRSVLWKRAMVWVLSSRNKEECSFQHFKVIKS